ncbi:MAG: hypothetical protein AAGI46_08035 [Planctomycetota bacterium]
MTEPEPRTLAYTAEPDTARPGWLTIVVWLVAIWHMSQLLRFGMGWRWILTDPGLLQVPGTLRTLMLELPRLIVTITICAYAVRLAFQQQLPVVQLGWLCATYLLVWGLTIVVMELRPIMDSDFSDSLWLLNFYLRQVVILLIPAILFLKIESDEPATQSTQHP